MSKFEEVGEEIHFMFHYGNERRVKMKWFLNNLDHLFLKNFSFGSNEDVELDMSDCTFENFLRCFGEIIGKVRNYCAHLSALPICEKRFRTSFCKKRKFLNNCF